MPTYATWNPADLGTSVTLSNGNLTAARSGGTNSIAVRSTIGKSSGKHYWETTCVSHTTNGVDTGISQSTAGLSFAGAVATSFGYFADDGKKYNAGSGAVYGNTFTDGDVIGTALDMDNGKVWFSKNGTWQASGDPAAGTNAAFTGLSGTYFAHAPGAGSGAVAQTVTANFGASAFAFSVPSGFNAGLYTVTAPVADFSGTPVSGTTPLTVAFTDLSTGDAPTSWAWTFGDGGTSTAQNPSHVYASAGTYNVGLTATNSGGSNLATKNAYITVSDVVVVPTTAPSGGLVDLGSHRRKKTKEELAAEREKFGIPDLARIAIEEAAKRQALAQEDDAQKRFEELARELTLRGIEWDVRYLEAMNVIRERIIEEEARRTMQAKRDEEDVQWLLQSVAEIA